MAVTKKSYAFQVSPQSVDFNRSVTLSSLIDLMLTAAQYNAEENGFGLRKLNDMGLSWVLLRMALEMDVFPMQYETVYIETWIEDIGRASTTRNFCLRNKKGGVIGYATSTWAMISRTTRKAQDLFGLGDIRSFESQETVPIDRPEKLGEIKGTMVNAFKAKYSHIDINLHVNTMRYVEWISNCFSLEHYNRKQIKRFDVNFMSEILFGDDVKVYCSDDSKETYSFEICRNEKTSCRAKLVFKSKN